MPFRIPGTQVKVRLFERVETADKQYDVFDVGVQHNDGRIDSVVVGGSFATAKSWVQDLDDKAAKKREEEANSSDDTAPAAA